MGCPGFFPYVTCAACSVSFLFAGLFIFMIFWLQYDSESCTLYSDIKHSVRFARYFPLYIEKERNKMTYESFLDILERNICSMLSGEEQVRRIQILKNNGVKLDGFSYQIPGHREQPTVYVNQYYRKEMKEEELRGVAQLVLKIQRDSRLFPEEELTQVLDYERMKDRIFFRLISKEKNEELLTQVPWLPWLDLAIVFYLRIPEHIVQNATALIHNNHMEYWGLTLGQLYRIASGNMKKQRFMLEPMEHFLGYYGIEAVNSGMYVLSTEKKEYGAAVILSQEVQRKCRELLGEDYYVLPSSVHELILLPRSIASGPRELEKMVREVNAQCVSREDFLSDCIYLYSSKLGLVR